MDTSILWYLLIACIIILIALILIILIRKNIVRSEYKKAKKNLEEYEEVHCGYEYMETHIKYKSLHNAYLCTLVEYYKKCPQKDLKNELIANLGKTDDESLRDKIMNAIIKI